MKIPPSQVYKEQWKLKTDYSRDDMNERIKIFVSNRGWQYALRLIKESGIILGNLKVAEVGSGIGTFSLTLALMGARVTLIDFNQAVLDAAKHIYRIYGLDVECICDDVLNNPPDRLINSFDIVSSYGLVEHFRGDNRQQAIKYHKGLLRRGGFAMISVPNKSSPLYWWIRLFRRCTGTWWIPLESPFSNRELNRLAQELGFESSFVVGYASLWNDIKISIRGFISAIIEILPKSFSNQLKKWHRCIQSNLRKALFSNSKDDMAQYCAERTELIHQETSKLPKWSLSDHFSSSLILLAFK